VNEPRKETRGIKLIFSLLKKRKKRRKSVSIRKHAGSVYAVLVHPQKKGCLRTWRRGLQKIKCAPLEAYIYRGQKQFYQGVGFLGCS
jgi:hypothetical protein